MKKEDVDAFEGFMRYALDRMYYDTGVISSGIRKGAGERCTRATNCGEICFLSLISLGLLSAKKFFGNCFHYLRWMTNITTLDNSAFYDAPFYIRVGQIAI